MKKMILLITGCIVLNGLSEKVPVGRPFTPSKEMSSPFGIVVTNEVTSAETLLQMLADAPRKYNQRFIEENGLLDSDKRQEWILDTLKRRGDLDGSWQYAGPMPQSADKNVKRWLELLAVPPSDTEGVLRLLNDPSPPVRYLGIGKAASLETLPGPVQAKLEDIARTDDYVRIGASCVDTLLRIAEDEVYTDFMGIRRWDAKVALWTRAHISIREYEGEQVSWLGLAYLNRLVKGGHDKGEIAFALYSLWGYGGKLWSEVNAQRKSYPQFAALFQAWDDAKKRGTLPPDAEGQFMKRVQVWDDWLAAGKKARPPAEADDGSAAIAATASLPLTNETQRLEAVATAEPEPPAGNAAPSHGNLLPVKWIVAGAVLLVSLCAILYLLRGKSKR